MSQANEWRGEEFVWRFCLHILPKHCSRLWAVGLFHTKKRQEKLALVRHLLNGETYDAFEQARIETEKAAKEEAESSAGHSVVYSVEPKPEIELASNDDASPEYAEEPITTEEWLAFQNWKEEQLQIRFDRWPGKHGRTPVGIRTYKDARTGNQFVLWVQHSVES